MMDADLHLHTTASDGACEPEEVIRLAYEQNLKAVAITDHDTASGLHDADMMGHKLGIKVIPGIELSTIWSASGKRKELHILGYYIDPKSERLETMLNRFLTARRERAKKIIHKLQELGVELSYSELEAGTNEEFVGRLHIARLMADKGYISEPSQAFTEEYIGFGGRAYVERFKLEPAEAIELLAACGGVPVIAHPGFLHAGGRLSKEEITELIALGIRGLEVIYPRHDRDQKEYYSDLAEKYGLVVTGGSDFHGDVEREVLPGQVRIPLEFVERLEREAEMIRTNTERR